jgi:hypothetical protein
MFSSKSKPLPTARLTAAPRNAIASKQDGVLLGENCGSTERSPNVYWNPEKLANPHGAILGASGSGKTQTLKAIAIEAFRTYGMKLVVIDFHGDQSLPGETVYQLHASSEHGINPLVIDLSTTGGGPNLQAIAIASSFTQALKMGANQQGLMIDLLMECYKRRGIGDDPATWRNDPPNLSDLETLLDERITGGCKESPRLLLKLRATFEYGIFSRQQPDILREGIIRIDLSELAKVPGLQAIAAETVCKQLIDHYRLLGESHSAIPRALLFIDECKELKGQRTSDRIIADGRKYGLGLWVASQRLQHLSAEILSNTQTKIILPVDASDVPTIARKIRFHDVQIAGLKPLNALIRLGSDSFKVKIKPYYERY